jgi:integrase
LATIRKREGKKGVSWQIDYFDPNGKRVRQSFKKRKDAEAELGKRVSLIAEKRYLDVKRDYTTTLGDLLQKYTENYEHQRSFQSNKCHWLENFKAYFGEDTRLSNIRYVNVETYQNHLKHKPTKHGTIRKEATINREMTCLRHIFRKAVEWDMIEHSPFGKGKSLSIKENNQRLRFLSEEEIQRLLPECSRYLRRIVECAIHTGMRRGEILSLKWSQIRNGYIYLATTKTNEPRQVPIDDDLAKILREIRRQQQLRSEYVFTYRKGEHSLKGPAPVRKRIKPAPVAEVINDVKTAFRSALKRAGVEDFRFHDLRHTFASQLIMRGGTLKDVQEVLGHKTMTMTLRYAHLSQEHKKKAVNRLNGLTAIKKEECHKTVTSSPVPLSLGL